MTVLWTLAHLPWTFNSSCITLEPSTRGNNLIDDLCTVAITCGFDAYGNEKAAKKTVVGKVQEYYYHDVNTGKKAVLFTVRSFGNGNLHLKLSSRFLLKLNAKFGQLKGWLKNAEDMVNETNVLDLPGVTIDDVEEALGQNLMLPMPQSPFLLLH